MTRPEIEPRSPGPWTNTLLIFANGLGDLGSIQDQVIPKTEKMVLMPPCLTLNYKVQIKGKWSNPEKSVVFLLTSQCSSNCKCHKINSINIKPAFI